MGDPYHRHPPRAKRVGAARTRAAPSGLTACDDGTVIRAFRCDNQFTCTQRFGGRTAVGQGTVASGGNFSVAVDPDLVGSALLMLEAEIETTIYRALDIGRAGAGAVDGRAAGVLGIIIAPTSEASVEILDGNGLGNFPEEGFVEVSAAVVEANAGTTFAGLGAAAAAQLAKDNALGNAGVTDAVMQNRSGRLCVDTIWRATASPFVVVNSVIVGGSLCPDGQQNVTLTIEPGVEVRFRDGLGLRVRSTLVARGTADSAIIFTSDQEFPEIGDWIGLLFEDSASDGVRGPNGEYQGGSILEHALVTWAKGVPGSPGAVTFEAANPILRDLVVRDCGTQGSAGRGVVHLSNTGGLVVERLIVEMNDTAGGSAVQVTHQGAEVQIIDSAILNNDGTGLSLSGPTMVRDSSIRGNAAGMVCRHNVTVLRSTITDNDGRGVDHAGSGREFRVRESTITANRGEALRCTQGAICELSDTLIAGNRLGTFLNANCLIRRNCFVDNGAGATDNPGVFINGGIACDLADNTLIGDGILMSFGQVLNIHRNNLLGTPVALETREQIGRPDFDVSGNWWGTTNDDAILGSVIDCNIRPVACLDPFPEAQAPIAAAPDIGACAEGRLERGQ